MIRGTQQQMIVLHTGRHRYFEQVLFILKRELTPPQADEQAMLREANRILEEGTRSEQERKRQAREKRILCASLFLAGTLSGILGMGILWAVLG